MKLKKTTIAVLAAVCLLGCLAFPTSAEFQASRSYTPGQFPDVALAAWYTPYVAAVYELGLMQGNSIGAFCPGGDVTVAETAALAARLHKLYHTGAADFQQGSVWHQVYVDYLRDNGILLKEYPDYNAKAKRSEFAAMLARAVPTEALAERNTVADGQIPDVAVDADYADEIYRLYRAGVLTGNDAYGVFLPENSIRRSEVAAIIARMAKPELRCSFTLKIDNKYPDLPKQSIPAEDGFFADAAMLGNSLVDGMMLCSKLPMDYYGGTGLTVFNNKLNSLLQKQYGKVYIEFGINEIGGSADSFISAYRKIIEQLHTAMPDAQVYIMAVTPVTKARSDEGIFTMKKIRSFNEALYALAQETDCWYLDSCENLCDGGYLPTGYGGWDGSPHLDASGYVAWAEVIRSYYVK